MALTNPPSIGPVASYDRFPAWISASSIVAGATSGHHVLSIVGYSRTKSALPNGKYILSRPFRVAGRTWAIYQFEFSFVDQVEEQTSSHIGNLTASRFVAGANSWGYKEFIKRDNLEQSGRLKDDCFTIRCDIIVAKGLTTEDAVFPGAPFVVVPPADWPQHLRALLLGGKGADVTFHVLGETFSAHRCVLAARSPVFDALLFGPMKEGTTTESCIQIDGMLPQVFESLLHFIYTDSLQETEGQVEAGATMMTQHLLVAADRYDMQRLKMICEDRLCRHIDVTTVATTLALADQHHCQGLKKACFEFLKSPKMLDEVMATDGFQHLAKSSPSALFELMSKLAER
ncbi:unnamed protein product [Urochloa decumbens]|uniref:BTB domain-containing protein n=1 Tax=Urochloa decumbens TaxID=240449 RepID=A0ABC8YFH3_9POAL